MVLTHVGNDEWEITLRNKTVKKYHTTDIRMSFVWFTECFYEESEVQLHEEQKNAHTVDVVIDKFVADMRKKGILKEGEELPSKFDLAFLIMKNYIIYPIENHEPISPINYCMYYTKTATSFAQSAINYMLSFVC